MNRSHEKEMMDLAGNPKALLEDDLRNLRVLNRYLGGLRSVRKGLSQVFRQQEGNSISVLDVGTGSGDIPAAIAGWARRRGVKVKIVAVEREPTTARVAAKLIQERKKSPLLYPPPRRGGGKRWGKGVKEGDFRGGAISVVRGDAMMLPFPPRSFDCILASQLLHHFSEEQIVSMLKLWSQIAGQAIIVSDLIRHPVGYHGIRILTRLFSRNMMTLIDAPLSVKRAFKFAEWHDLFARAAIGPFEILPVFPFRMVAIFSVAGPISLPSSPSLEGEDKGEGGVLGRSASG
ncbi:MAG TPA: methyltransferase domain-containing protein [Candidatus Binatia bacterium]|nr:methyltransferase domain-containing protein [Candidatus Binatia bacterium]